MKILRPTMAALSASIIATGIGCLVSLPAGSQAGSAQAQAGSAQAQLVDAAGNMHIPDNYRINYEYLGSWSVAGDEKGAKEMHTVYASPGAAEAYRTTGKFPDGSVLVKEVLSTATAAMTTGTVSHVDRLKGWFMMVKDSKNSHPDNKLFLTSGQVDLAREVVRLPLHRGRLSSGETVWFVLTDVSDFATSKKMGLTRAPSLSKAKDLASTRVAEMD